MLGKAEELGLSVRSHRSVVVGMVLVALAAVPVAASCGDEAPGCCCSTREGGCPMPARQEAPRPGCCEAAPAPAPTTIAAPAQLDSLPVADAPLDPVADPALDSATVACSDTRAHPPPGVSLHTLHAVFLI